VSTLDTPAATTSPLPEPERERPTHRSSRKALRVWLLFLAIAVSFAAGVLTTRYTQIVPGLSLGSLHQASPLQQAPYETQVVALGRLEPEGGVIQVGGPPGDRLARILVEDGSEVEKGQELVYLESYSDRLAEKDLAESQLQEAITRKQAVKKSGEALVEQARLRIEQITREYPFVLQAQEAKVRLVESQLETANKELARLQAADPTVVSPQQLNQQQFAVRQAKEELTAARAGLGKLRTEQPLNLRPPKFSCGLPKPT
jgi:HlyD family secretion protein